VGEVPEAEPTTGCENERFTVSITAQKHITTFSEGGKCPLLPMPAARHSKLHITPSSSDMQCRPSSVAICISVECQKVRVASHLQSLLVLTVCFAPRILTSCHSLWESISSTKSALDSAGRASVLGGWPRPTLVSYTELHWSFTRCKAYVIPASNRLCLTRCLSVCLSVRNFRATDRIFMVILSDVIVST